MLMKVVVVGCTHAGTAAVRELLMKHPETEVDVFERREDISFLSVTLILPQIPAYFNKKQGAARHPVFVINFSLRNIIF